MTKEQKLLRNIYFAALHHKKLNSLLKDDLLSEDCYRQKALGSFDAYSYIVQMIVHSDSIGNTDYKKVFEMEETFPKIY